jgi:hypothetical protein
VNKSGVQMWEEIGLKVGKYGEKWGKKEALLPA